MKLVVGIGVLVAIGAILKAAHHGSSSTSREGAGSNVFLVASGSYCLATGIDDAYTGNGHVTFYMTFRNNGAEDESVNATPVREYNDGDFNDSPMDEVTVDVPAGQTLRVRTTAMTYKAHEHEVVGCALRIPGHPETSIAVH